MKLSFWLSLTILGILIFGSVTPAAALTLPNPLGSADFETLIANMTTYIAGFAGALASVMFIIAGIVFISSGGNPGKIDQAKRIAIYAAIGAGIAIAGGGLVALVAYIIGG